MRSTLTTSAPRSQRWRVARGAATACSKATTRTPARGIEDVTLFVIRAGFYGSAPVRARRLRLRHDEPGWRDARHWPLGTARAASQGRAGAFAEARRCVAPGVSRRGA